MWSEIIVLSSAEYEHRKSQRETVCLHCGQIESGTQECTLCHSTHLVSFSEAANLGIVDVNDEVNAA